MTELVLTDVHKRFGDHSVLAGLDLSVPAGSFTALLGPSGAGKTTLLRLLAGFDQPDRGTIALGGRVIADDHIHVPPGSRRIGYVPQEGSLFPHLTVNANVGFGLPRSQRHKAVTELLAMVGLGGLGGRYPHQLSGGQQQRVALARALAVKPEVVLLDEPFASLDAQLRSGVRDDVRRILGESGTTTLLVTHNQDEALSSADQVAVLRDGRVIQHASPQELYGVPADGELASFVGDANLLEGIVRDGIVETSLGFNHAQAEAVHSDDHASRRVTVLIRPEQIDLANAVDSTSPRGRVVRCDYHGHDTLIRVRLGAEGTGPVVLARVLGGQRLTVGQQVTLTARDPVSVWPAPQATGDSVPDTGFAHASGTRGPA
jgi:iron(III) transport system ATP-binding protein